MGGTAEVLPDVTGLDRTFHYRAGGELPGAGGGSTRAGVPLRVGTIVRVELHGRRVRGWVVGLDTPLPEGLAGLELRPVLEVVSAGPPPDVVELARWAAWRYCGRLRLLLVAASPGRLVRAMPPTSRVAPPSASRPQPRDTGPVRPQIPPSAHAGPPTAVEATVAQALRARDAVLRLPPAEERLPVVEAALSHLRPGNGGQALVLVEEREDVLRLSAHLRRAERRVACLPEDWVASASAADVVIGTRSAAFAPSSPVLTVVLDAHSEGYRSPKAPCYDARAVVAERARREGSAVIFVTPCPSVELLADEKRSLVTLPETVEREGWGAVAVLDSRSEDPVEGGYPSHLVGWIRDAVAAGGPPVVCVLNRVGRARLLTCGRCKQVQRCPRCGTAQVQLAKPAKGEIGVLTCPRCGEEQPAICPSCGSARLRVARPGVSRAREQLAAVTGVEVGEVSRQQADLPPTPVVVGTEAVLHRLRNARLVVWLDFDQELLAPRFRAAEEALAKLARSVRLAGGRGGGGRVVIRTSLPEHEVVRAARLGDPGLVVEAERERRRLLELPPYSSLARFEGEGAEMVAARLDATGSGLQLTRLDEESWLARSETAARLADALGSLASEDPAGWAGLGVRVEMEPVDL